ncbi:MAG: hypothetical protein JRJ69_16015 [Deltaproteobacteria bacterium]|nr:hypothetical protein [Deltaproteobacteria bacterium]MBW1738999.1 hypothetical protein [Deltaproteobacteria bacterium]MBW1911275.1 hypothetical protein [Deltaproteobacteria bacterium]MBW2035093.1 hypothetical protein [Deltaproteobacteria bacterium]MBW2115590.1 hypothetical protein [Deltaproteobacteria bacterium]
MEPIPEELVEETWQEFAGFSRVGIQKETVKVNKNQPNLVAFMMEFTQDLDQEVRELAIYMSYVICRMFQKSSKKGLKRISPEEIISYYEKTERLIESLEGTDEKFLERIAEVQLSGQPYVMKYVLETLMEAPEEEEPIALTEEDIGYLFLLFKTLVDVIDKNT